MAIDLFLRIPMIRSWIERTVAAHAASARPVGALVERLGFRRLPGYFDAAFLRRVRCVAVERVPLPQLDPRDETLSGSGRRAGPASRTATALWAALHEQSESQHFPS
jgi:hypothetical protein